jgi:hypothetical protein
MGLGGYKSEYVNVFRKSAYCKKSLLRNLSRFTYIKCAAKRGLVNEAV